MAPFVSLDSQAFWHPPVLVPGTAAAKHIRRLEEKRQPVAVRQVPQTSSLAHGRQAHSPRSQPWTSIDVISIPSDDESEISDQNEFDAEGTLYEQIAGESDPDEPLPLISALVASTAAARQDCYEFTEDFGEQLDGSQRADDSDDLACPVASPPTTSAPDAEAAPPNSNSSTFQRPSPLISAMLLSVPTWSCQEDEAHQRVTFQNSSLSWRAAFRHILRNLRGQHQYRQIHPVHSNRGAEDVYEDDGGSQNDGCLHHVAQPALAFPSTADSSCGASFDCRSSSEGEAVKQPCMDQSDPRGLRPETPASHGRARGTRRKARVDDKGHSRSDELNRDEQCGSQGPRGTRTKHNLRPHPSKKLFFGEYTNGEDDHLPASKRRGAPVPASRRRDAQRDSEVPRVRGRSRACAEQRAKEGNAATAAAVTGLSHAAIAMYEEWPLSDATLNSHGPLPVEHMIAKSTQVTKRVAKALDRQREPESECDSPADTLPTTLSVLATKHGDGGEGDYGRRWSATVISLGNRKRFPAMDAPCLAAPVLLLDPDLPEDPGCRAALEDLRDLALQRGQCHLGVPVLLEDPLGRVGHEGHPAPGGHLYHPVRHFRDAHRARHAHHGRAVHPVHLVQDHPGVLDSPDSPAPLQAPADQGSRARPEDQEVQAVQVYRGNCAWSDTSDSESQKEHTKENADKYGDFFIGQLTGRCTGPLRWDGLGSRSACRVPAARSP
ncbi:hypothetical protein Purlil1_12832 [Purpureocillium lilacinum]|uniref:Uncharacterized protein n=1 Tax=Purpureocillium lilacinum TaxID=33203 RepID=A0ABR0BFU1_PURLI|nr:hypothetical protein Purlil1_12832 [Purpureocillium lilacinum]